MPGSVLSRVEESLIAVLTLTEGLEEADLSRSRLTRREVRRHLLEAAAALREAARAQPARLPELDFSLWAERADALAAESRETQDAALWSLVRSEVPQTIGWLRIYRSQSPDLFTEGAS